MNKQASALVETRALDGPCHPPHVYLIGRLPSRGASESNLANRLPSNRHRGNPRHPARPAPTKTQFKCNRVALQGIHRLRPCANLALFGGSATEKRRADNCGVTTVACFEEFDLSHSFLSNSGDLGCALVAFVASPDCGSTGSNELSDSTASMVDESTDCVAVHVPTKIDRKSVV